jgi:hypothetical protein
MNLEEIRRKVQSIDESKTHDDVATIRVAVDEMKSQAGEIAKMMDTAQLEYQRATGCEITIGDIRYYIGEKKKVECKDSGRVMETLLNAGGGDVGFVTSHMGSSPWKYGQIRQTLEETASPTTFDDLFTTVVEEEVKEGKATKKKVLHKVNTAFTK